MKQALIRLSKSIIIDSTTKSEFENNIFTKTLNETKYQFNHSLINKLPLVNKDANEMVNQLNNNVYRSINSDILGLENLFPGGFTDKLGHIDINFEDIKFKIIESDISNDAKHKVMLVFYFPIMTLLDHFDNNLVLSFGNKSSDVKENKSIDTFLLEVDSTISICSYQII